MARLYFFRGITVAENEPAKKLPCPDCTFCQWCSDDRCRMCRKKSCGKKLSLREQIELYDRINAERMEGAASKAAQDDTSAAPPTPTTKQTKH